MQQEFEKYLRPRRVLHDEETLEITAIESRKGRILVELWYDGTSCEVYITEVVVSLLPIVGDHVLHQHEGRTFIGIVVQVVTTSVTVDWSNSDVAFEVEVTIEAKLLQVLDEKLLSSLLKLEDIHDFASHLLNMATLATRNLAEFNRQQLEVLPITASFPVDMV